MRKKSLWNVWIITPNDRRRARVLRALLLTVLREARGPEGDFALLTVLSVAELHNPCWLRDHVVYFYFFRSHLLFLIYAASVKQLPPQTVLPVLPFFPRTDLLIKAIMYGQYVNPACTPSQFPSGETHRKIMFLWAKIYRKFVDLVLWCVVFQHISITKCKMKQDLPRKNRAWLFWAHLFIYLFFTGSIIL